MIGVWFSRLHVIATFQLSRRHDGPHDFKSKGARGADHKVKGVLSVSHAFCSGRKTMSSGGATLIEPSRHMNMITLAEKMDENTKRLNSI